MKSKENIFTKGSYDVQLEEILEKKNYSDEGKSLILNIMYRIENSYRDYAKIKPASKLKNEIIEEIVGIVQNECEEIQITDPKEAKSRFSVDKKKKSIKTYPTEVNLLQALYYLNTPDYKDNEDIIEQAVSFVLNKGLALNSVEIIRDFDGWSWNNNIDLNSNKYYNLVFQDLCLILGESTITEIVKQGNIIEKLY